MFDIHAIGQDFGRAAGTYDANAHLQATIRARCLGLAADLWQEGAHILDAGCGTGALAEEQKTWRVTGLDLAFGMCAAAGEKGIPVVNAGADAMPFESDVFDGIFSSLMLQWADDPLKVFREMARVTKPGGSCVIATFVQGTLAELREAFAAVDQAPHISNFLPAPELLLRAAHAGLRVIAAEEETQLQHYPDALALMRHLKSIGAGHKAVDRRRGLTPPRIFAEMAEAYRQRFTDGQGLRASWQLLYMVVEKI